MATLRDAVIRLLRIAVIRLLRIAGITQISRTLQAVSRDRTGSSTSSRYEVPGEPMNLRHTPNV